jgi:drug/metabolite transporter (DMT)-like permease
MAAGGKPLQAALLTTVTMVAFAANSIFCRKALEIPSLDAVSFTTVRLLTGAMTLWLIMRFARSKDRIGGAGNWWAALALFVYAIAFSFAYLELGAGAGALILFGAVQITMVLVGLWSGERLSPVAWTGFIIALVGLVLLVTPGMAAPSMIGSIVMGIAGVAWGIYSLLGRNVDDPLANTAANFVRATPLTVIASLILISHTHLTPEGLLWAALSGSLTSGCGYVIWYAALKRLTATRAAIVQVSVPILAALGGVFFLSEIVTVQMLVSCVLVLGGIAMVVK